MHTTGRLCLLTNINNIHYFIRTHIKHCSSGDGDGGGGGGGGGGEALLPEEH